MSRMTSLFVRFWRIRQHSQKIETNFSINLRPSGDGRSGRPPQNRGNSGLPAFSLDHVAAPGNTIAYEPPHPASRSKIKKGSLRCLPSKKPPKPLTVLRFSSKCWFVWERTLFMPILAAPACRFIRHFASSGIGSAQFCRVTNRVAASPLRASPVQPARSALSWAQAVPAPRILLQVSLTPNSTASR